MMVYVCIDGCKVDGHAIAVVEFAGITTILCNDEGYVDLSNVSMAIAEGCR